jgi:alkaline phosphatase D
MGKLGNGKELRNMVAVGSAFPDGVRLWFRSERPGKHRVEIRRIGGAAWTQSVHVALPRSNKTDNTISFHYPRDFTGKPALQSRTLYKYKVTRVAGGEVLGQGSFETAPATEEETPDEFSFGIMSCHQPFNDDGAISKRRDIVVNLAAEAFRARDTKFVLATGDQMYADSPGEFSLKEVHYFRENVEDVPGGLLEASAPQIRRAYQERYRQFWSMPRLRKIYQDNPCYPILDDHEILDDWGSQKKHRSMAYSRVFSGARQAYADYQRSRVSPPTTRLPASFHYSFDYGRLAGFVMDLRSERKTGSRRNTIYGAKQFADLERFLKEKRDKHVLVLVVSVPVVHIPSWIADTGSTVAGTQVDFVDHWSFYKNLHDRDRLLKLLHKHHQERPTQRILLVGGDVHISAAFAIQWKGGTRPTLYQFTSSAISNRLSGLNYWLSKQGPSSVKDLSTGPKGPAARVHLIKGNVANNPCGGLNVGVVRVRHRGEHSTVEFEILGYRSKSDKKLVPLFSTGEL